MPVARTIRSVLVWLLFAGVASGQEASDVYRVQLFSAPAARVVAVGEELRFDVHGVAVPRGADAAERLVHALQRMAFPSGINEDFQVVEATPTTILRRADTEILDFSRRFTLRARHSGWLTVPAVVVPLDDGSETTHVHKRFSPTVRMRLCPAPAKTFSPLVAHARIGRRVVERIGSGFLIGPDALVTAYHVVIGADRVRVRLPGGESITTNKVWAMDPVRDVAILHVDPESILRAQLVPLQLSLDLARGSSSLEGGVSFTAGWPGGIQQSTAGEHYRSLRFETGDLLGVSSNAVRPGDSGGPLLNERGEVIGVVSSGRSTNQEPDMLQEDVCLAADPRRALAVRMVRDEPVSLREALLDAAQDAPNGEVIQAASMLMMQGHSGRNADAHLAQIASAAQRAPHDAALQFLAGSVFEAMGDDDRAEASYQAALEGLSEILPGFVRARGHALPTWRV